MVTMIRTSRSVGLGPSKATVFFSKVDFPIAKSPSVSPGPKHSRPARWETTFKTASRLAKTRDSDLPRDESPQEAELALKSSNIPSPQGKVVKQVSCAIAVCAGQALGLVDEAILRFQHFRSDAQIIR